MISRSFKMFGPRERGEEEKKIYKRTIHLQVYMTTGNEKGRVGKKRKQETLKTELKTK